MKRFIPAQIKHKKEQVIFSFGKKKKNFDEKNTTKNCKFLQVKKREQQQINNS